MAHASNENFLIMKVSQSTIGYKQNREEQHACTCTCWLAWSRFVHYKKYTHSYTHTHTHTHTHPIADNLPSKTLVARRLQTYSYSLTQTHTHTHTHARAHPPSQIVIRNVNSSSGGLYGCMAMGDGVVPMSPTTETYQFCSKWLYLFDLFIYYF